MLFFLFLLKSVIESLIYSEINCSVEAPIVPLISNAIIYVNLVLYLYKYHEITNDEATKLITVSRGTFFRLAKK